ncbi:MAG: hypothetical protein Kapaf2KO_10140 [Candidatus Kapaibacteriales bacterium]
MNKNLEIENSVVVDSLKKSVEFLSGQLKESRREIDDLVKAKRHQSSNRIPIPKFVISGSSSKSETMFYDYLSEYHSVMECLILKLNGNEVIPYALTGFSVVLDGVIPQLVETGVTNWLFTHTSAIVIANGINAGQSMSNIILAPATHGPDKYFLIANTSKSKNHFDSYELDHLSGVFMSYLTYLISINTIVSEKILESNRSFYSPVSGTETLIDISLETALKLCNSNFNGINALEKGVVSPEDSYKMIKDRTKSIYQIIQSTIDLNLFGSQSNRKENYVEYALSLTKTIFELNDIELDWDDSLIRVNEIKLEAILKYLGFVYERDIISGKIYIALSNDIDNRLGSLLSKGNKSDTVKIIHSTLHLGTSVSITNSNVNSALISDELSLLLKKVDRLGLDFVLDDNDSGCLFAIK